MSATSEQRLALLWLAHETSGPNAAHAKVLLAWMAEEERRSPAMTHPDTDVGFHLNRDAKLAPEEQAALLRVMTTAARLKK